MNPDPVAYSATAVWAVIAIFAASVSALGAAALSTYNAWRQGPHVQVRTVRIALSALAVFVAGVVVLAFIAYPLWLNGAPA